MAKTTSSQTTEKKNISGKYINIGNEGFESIRNGEYVDKSKLIHFVNSCLNTPQKLICVSRPRRFGKCCAPITAEAVIRLSYLKILKLQAIHLSKSI